jgi:hypothetical protein
MLRKAFTEILISQNDKPNEISKHSKLIPKDRCQLIADRERGVTWQKRKGTDSIPEKLHVAN